ncbi:MAG: FAD-dependent oxidoreductase [Candidatus Bipolaricaulota bacterium]
MTLEADVLILGSGIAGAAVALHLSRDPRRRVLVVSRASDPTDGATSWAQGGIVGHVAEGDPDLLVRDLLAAGAGLTLPEAAQRLAEAGPHLVTRVLVEELGVPFCRSAAGTWSLAQEGGHSTERVLHVRDETGAEIERHLIAALLRRANVTLLPAHTAIDLLTLPHHSDNPLRAYRPVRCFGAYLLDQANGEVLRALAPFTVLSTGGLGQIFRHTTNPSGSRGDGFAMAHRAGVRLENMEYVQFHPTSLAVPGARNALITEALRGAGAQLRTPDGEAFMRRYAPAWGDLAPRDVVARAMHSEMVRRGYPHLLLDARSVFSRCDGQSAFPNVLRNCGMAGIDPCEEPIPVVPAAHYACGGVLVDRVGRTSLEGLYAVGEVSCTGVHGANRLASTSLLEGLVWGTSAGEDIATRSDVVSPPERELREWEATGSEVADPVLVLRDLESIQNTMWHYVGLSRRADRLARASDDLDHIWKGIGSFYRTRKVDDGLVGLRNAAQCAWVTCLAALRNRSSCGAHWREDAPA